MSCQTKPGAQQMWYPRASVFLLLLLATACARAPKEESGVRTVAAKIEGITCPTCVPPLTASLRRQFDKAAAIDVDEKQNTATVQLGAHQDFSPEAFHQAVARVRMRVRAFSIEACGRVEGVGDQRWLTAGSSRFLVHSDRDLPLNQPLCLQGGLDASHDPVTLNVTTFERQNAGHSGT